MQRHAITPIAVIIRVCQPAFEYALNSHISAVVASTASAEAHFVKGESATAAAPTTVVAAKTDKFPLCNAPPMPSNRETNRVTCILKHAEDKSTTNPNTVKNRQKLYTPTPLRA